MSWDLNSTVRAHENESARFKLVLRTVFFAPVPLRYCRGLIRIMSAPSYCNTCSRVRLVWWQEKKITYRSNYDSVTSHRVKFVSEGTRLKKNIVATRKIMNSSLQLYRCPQWIYKPTPLDRSRCC